MACLESLCKLVWHRMSFSSPTLAALGCSAIAEREVPRAKAVQPRGGLIMAAAATKRSVLFFYNIAILFNPTGGVKSL